MSRMMPTMIFWKRGISLLSLTAMAAAQEVWDYGDPDLNPWTWWKRAVPDARYPPFATGRRFRMTSEVATKVEEAAPLTDERGVTLPCVVDPFAGSTRPLWLPFEVDDSERGTTVAADEEGEGFGQSWEGKSNRSRHHVHVRCRQAYGSVLANYSAISLRSPATRRMLEELSRGSSSELVPPSLADAAGSLLESLRDADESGESADLQQKGDGASPVAIGALTSPIGRLVRASKLDLKYSDDLGRSQMAVELQTRRHRFAYPVNVGVLFYLEIDTWGLQEDSSRHAKEGAGSFTSVVRHFVGVTLSRTSVVSLFHHSAVDGASAKATSFYDYANPVLQRSPATSASTCSADKTDAKTCDKTGVSHSESPPLNSDSGKTGFNTSTNAMRPPLKMMTFNVWNVNPPNYVYHDAASRWARYSERIDHLARVIAEADPDIVAFQEVRHDDKFGPIEEHQGRPSDRDEGLYMSSFPRATVPLGSFNASQSVHLFSRLGALGFGHFAYHPAMLYYRPPMGGDVAPWGGLREEEGPAIASKFPIVSTEHLLLPRDGADHEDGHQRALLHAEIAVPGWGERVDLETSDSAASSSSASFRPGLVDVYSTHLSLSEKGRDRSVGAMLTFADQGRGVAQIIAGDLNAEPNEPAMRCLRADYSHEEGHRRHEGRSSSSLLPEDDNREVEECRRWKAEAHAGASDSSVSGRPQPSGSSGVPEWSVRRSGAFADAWLALHDEPSPRSTSPWEVRHALTFPSCNAVKRIDYVLVRGTRWIKKIHKDDQEHPSKNKEDTAEIEMSSETIEAADKINIAVEACEVVGQDPVNVHYEHRDGLGMLDEDSPVWASDHRAVVATLRLKVIGSPFPSLSSP